MNKKQQMLYLSGLISEENITENFDFESSLTAVQKTKNEFDKLYEKLLDCIGMCRDIQEQAINNNYYHKKFGLERVDSNGVEDSQYFEDLSVKIAFLHMALHELFGTRKEVYEVKESFQELIKRLNTDLN